MYKYLTKSRMEKVDSILNRRIPQIPARLIERNKIIEAKKIERAERIKRTHHRKLWTALRRDLVYERNNVRMGLRYKPVQNLEARTEVFEAYLAVLQKVEDKINDVANSGVTPSEYARTKNLPNNGIHWTDWVPPKIKQAIAQAFDALPHTPRAKRKLPFQRTRRPDKGNKDLQRLRQRTEKELEAERQLLNADPSNLPRRARISQMVKALQIMDTLKKSDALPATWHGLFVKAPVKKVPKRGEPTPLTLKGEANGIANIKNVLHPEEP